MQRKLKAATVALGAVLSSCWLIAGDAPAMSGKDAGAEELRLLQVGHARFLCGKADHPNTDSARRTTTFKDGQHPHAIFLSCADSRVPVEVIFDQGVGDLFVIRVAGNVADKLEAASIEYAVDHLDVPLLVIMGHRGCGAVSAAMSGTAMEGNLGALVGAIQPAVERAQRANPGMKGDGLLAEAVKANTMMSIETLLASSPSLQQMVKTKKLMIVGAVYDIETATVNWLGRHPDEMRLCSGDMVQDNASKPEGKVPSGKTAVAGATANSGEKEKGQGKPSEGHKPKASGGGHHR